MLEPKGSVSFNRSCHLRDLRAVAQEEFKAGFASKPPPTSHQEWLSGQLSGGLLPKGAAVVLLAVLQGHQ